MNTHKNQAEGRKTAELEVVTVTKSAVKSTMGGSGPIQEIDTTGGTKYG
ncbi:acinetodin/klebsidin/J25 family lasso peptide [Rhizobium mongolense]